MSIESEQAKQQVAEPSMLTGNDIPEDADTGRPATDTGDAAQPEGAQDSTERPPVEGYGNTRRPVSSGYDASGRPLPEGYEGSHRPLPESYDSTSGSAPAVSARGLSKADYATDTSAQGAQHNSGASDPNQLRSQWREVQTMFVDDPRDAVTRADTLVSGTIAQLTEIYAQRREDLERTVHESTADTEELRQALRGYRDLFDQLMTASAGGATNM